MGDVISLVERAQQSYDEEEARKLNKKIKKNQFGFDDFLTQMEQIKKMGSMKDLLGMIPGMGKAIKDIDIDDDSLKPIEAIIKSMTQHERTNPDVIYGSRRQRIANGSGTHSQDQQQRSAPSLCTNPDVINGSRRQRIANGSGTTVQEVNQLLRQFQQMRKMMKTGMQIPPDLK